MSIVHWPSKDAAAIADFDLDWTLDTGDLIVASSWVVLGAPVSLTITDDSWGSNVTKAWLAGGTKDATYTLVNTIVTALGRTFDQSVTISIKD